MSYLCIAAQSTESETQTGLRLGVSDRLLSGYPVVEQALHRFPESVSNARLRYLVTLDPNPTPDDLGSTVPSPGKLFILPRDISCK